MTTSNAGSPKRFRFLATFFANRPLGVIVGPAGVAAHTNGRYIFVSAGCSIPEQRREVLVQSALLGAGSLDRELVKSLRGRPRTARRYLALEGHRVLAELATQYPLAAEYYPGGKPLTATAKESLKMAKGWKKIANPPEWFGVIRPSCLLEAAVGAGTRATDKDLLLQFDLSNIPEADDDGYEEQGEESKILKMFSSPLGSQKLTDILSNFLGSSRSPGDGTAGADLNVGSIRRVNKMGAHARPIPVPLRIKSDDTPGCALGVGGVLYPEWDVHNKKYRPEWCRVIDFPIKPAADIEDAAVQHDEVLRRRLARVGLGPKIIRKQQEGEDLDLEALIDFYIDLNSGFSPPEHIYLERRKLARNLGVLILLDSSGSTTDMDEEGSSVHDHQRRAAATMAVTLEELGDRVAVYGFRSYGRSSVHLMAIKPFGRRFGASGRARLNQLEPEGYTRLGAAIRGAGGILKKEAGTPNRLLLVLSDGFPYDDGYEYSYAEGDARKALEELRADGVACLCLSIGTTTPEASLNRVFGSASRASAPKLDNLSHHMDELFLTALKELSVSNPHGRFSV